MTAAMVDHWANMLELLPDGGARSINRSTTNAAALAQAVAEGWTGSRLGAEIAVRIGPGLDNPAAFVASQLRQIAASGPPRGDTPTPSDHGQRLHWTQPIPACGRCDGGSSRWFQVADGVLRCPHCWTPPPGYYRPIQRCSSCRVLTACRTPQGDTLCPACAGGTAPKELI
jgi:hypothetical protein